jgi:hypothetical protein
VRRVAALAWMVCAGCLLPPLDTVVGSIDGGVPRVLGKPKMMFLIDKSVSMNFPNDSSSPACPANCNNGGSLCPSTCTTRLSVLRSAMATILDSHGADAWMGMAIYPTGTAANSSCTPTLKGDVKVELALEAADPVASMRAAAQNVNLEIQRLVPAGGTPTAGALRFLSTYQPLLRSSTDADREAYLVLITDGLPNCNEHNPNTCVDFAACRCTLANCTGAFCAQGCLDQDDSVAAIAELRTKGVKTIVVGFGVEAASGDGPAVLNKLAEAGGMSRTCVHGTDAECGIGDTCESSTLLCRQRYQRAIAEAELIVALDSMFVR